MVALLFEERDMALVERKIMATHVINAVKLFFTMNTDVNVLSMTGVYIIMVALCNRADHYIFILFLSSFFFFLA